MTNAPDDPARDPRLSAAWREHSSELPSAQLDATILAAAHRAVGSAPQSTGTDARDAATPARAATRPQRWWMPLAAAATIGAVALGILQTAPPDQLDVAPPSSDTRSTSDSRSTSPSAPSDAPSREKAVVAPEMAAPAEPFPAPKKQDAKERKDSSLGERGAAAPANTQRDVPPPAAAPRTMPPAAPASAPAPAVAAGNVAAQRAEADAAPSRPAVAAAPQPFPAEKKNEAADAIAPESQARDDAFAQQKRRSVDAPAPARMGAASDEARQRKTATPLSSTAATSSPPASSAEVSQSPAPSAVAALSKSTNAAPASGKIIDIDAAIVRIRRLHDDGKLADAAKELNALRATVPDVDARLPPELRAWAATVRQ